MSGSAERDSKATNVHWENFRTIYKWNSSVTEAESNGEDVDEGHCGVAARGNGAAFFWVCDLNVGADVPLSEVCVSENSTTNRTSICV